MLYLKLFALTLSVFTAAGTQPLVSTVKSEDSATEERIAQILNDAQQAMQVKKSMEQVCVLFGNIPVM